MWVAACAWVERLQPFRFGSIVLKGLTTYWLRSEAETAPASSARSQWKERGVFGIASARGACIIDTCEA